MGDDKRSDILFFAFKIRNIWDYEINSRSCFFGKLESGVNRDYFILIFKNHHVSADFFQAAKSDEPDRFVFFMDDFSFYFYRFLLNHNLNFF